MAFADDLISASTSVILLVWRNSPMINKKMKGTENKVDTITIDVMLLAPHSLGIMPAVSSACSPRKISKRQQPHTNTLPMQTKIRVHVSRATLIR